MRTILQGDKLSVISISKVIESYSLPLFIVAIALVSIIFQSYNLTVILIAFGLFGMSYNVCFGETGILTFGHAAFFGAGAYGAALFNVYISPVPSAALLNILVGILVALLVGFFIGAISLKRKGLALGLITLAFAQMIFFIVTQMNDITGGTDGLFGLSSPEVGIPGVVTVPVSTSRSYFVFALVVFTISAYLLRHIKHSNFGRVLNAIRENEERARFLGYKVYWYKLGAFTVSAAFSGLAGSLYALHINFVGTDTLLWILSGEVNFYVLLGGINTLIGPFIGAGIYIVLKDNISVLVEAWQLPIGVIIILIILFFPKGIVGEIKSKVLKNDTEIKKTDDQGGAK